MKRRNPRLIILIICASLLVLSITFLNFIAASDLFGEDSVIEVITVAIAFLLFGGTVAALFFFLSNRALVKSLRAENEYNLGVRKDFNNIYSFQRRLVGMSRLGKFIKKPHYLVAFTFSSSSVSQNVNRNAEIYELNNHISEFLETLPGLMNAKKSSYTFAFTRGAFLIHCFEKNEQAIQNMCEIISKDVYKYGEENCPHTWVQPFFGATLVNKEDSFMHQIENALLARDYSERNF